MQKGSVKSSLQFIVGCVVLLIVLVIFNGANHLVRECIVEWPPFEKGCKARADAKAKKETGKTLSGLVGIEDDDDE